MSWILQILMPAVECFVIPSILYQYGLPVVHFNWFSCVIPNFWSEGYVFFSSQYQGEVPMIDYALV